jgi:L-fucose isomerase-like protein
MTRNQLKELRIGIVPTRRESFSNPMAGERKAEIIAKMKSLEGELNFTGVYIENLNEEGLLMRYGEVPAAEEIMRAGKVDALFIPHCNFGQEEAIARLAKNMGVPVLVWGPRDGVHNGLEWRPTDSQCGMFASTKVLRRYGVMYSYIENCALDDAVFEAEFARFLAVAQVIKAFRNLRVAVVSSRPKEFLSVMVNEAELLEKFDIELVPAESTVIMGMVDRQLAENQEGCDKLLASLEAAGLDLSRLGEKKRTLAAIELALMEFADLHDCTALSSDCWKLFRSQYGIAPCFIFGDLNDRGLPTACENDIHAAILSAMAIAARRYETPSYVADLTIRHPENDNAELLWHCGPFAKTLKRGGAEGYIIASGQGYYEIEHGVHSVMRFDGLGGDYYLFAGTGRGVEGPITNGNYLWLETDNWIHWEKKFMFGPYIHHVVGVPGDVTSVMREACRYLGIRFDAAESQEFVYNL